MDFHITITHLIQVCQGRRCLKMAVIRAFHSPVFSLNIFDSSENFLSRLCIVLITPLVKLDLKHQLS